MINREITYERSVSRSYMKIPACLEASFDETIMLKKEISGFLPVEKCYVNGSGQYWYNITGKQALDSYTKMKEIGIRFVEKLLLNICTQLERLEWNLLGAHCMVLDPEFIFVGNGSEEIFFLLYPENKGEVHTELRKLIEYLLTRLNHKDAEAVKTLYAIYEITLAEGYSLGDIRRAIEKNKEEEKPENSANTSYSHAVHTGEIYGEVSRRPSLDKPENKNSKNISNTPKMEQPRLIAKLLDILPLEENRKKLQRLWEKAMKILKSEAHPIMCTDQMEVTAISERPKTRPSIEPTRKAYQLSTPPMTNPTVCLISPTGKERGVLMHQGLGAYPDYELLKRKCEIGNHPQADLYIEKDTVSCKHAGIDYQDGLYFIEDFNSTNGTYVNEVPLTYKQKLKLSSGDEIRFADVRYRFL